MTEIYIDRRRKWLFRLFRYFLPNWSVREEAGNWGWVLTSRGKGK